MNCIVNKDIIESVAKDSIINYNEPIIFNKNIDKKGDNISHVENTSEFELLIAGTYNITINAKVSNQTNDIIEIATICDNNLIENSITRKLLSNENISIHSFVVIPYGEKGKVKIINLNKNPLKLKEVTILIEKII